MSGRVPGRARSGASTSAHPQVLFMASSVGARAGGEANEFALACLSLLVFARLPSPLRFLARLAASHSSLNVR